MKAHLVKFAAQHTCHRRQVKLSIAQAGNAVILFFGVKDSKFY